MVGLESSVSPGQLEAVVLGHVRGLVVHNPVALVAATCSTLRICLAQNSIETSTLQQHHGGDASGTPLRFTRGASLLPLLSHLPSWPSLLAQPLYFLFKSQKLQPERPPESHSLQFFPILFPTEAQSLPPPPLPSLTVQLVWSELQGN